MRAVRRRHRQSKIGIALVILVMIVAVAACSIRTYNLNVKSRQLMEKEETLDNKIAEAELEAENLEAQRRYMQTDEYIEDEAKDKLNLVYPDEVVIKPNEN